MPKAPDLEPASGDSLVGDLSTARGFLSKWCVDRGINENAPDDENIRILVALISQSQELLRGSSLPKIPKKTVAIPARVDLTERRWSRFSRWFEEEYKSPMIRHCRATSAGVLVPQRESNGRGGRGDRYEARYFLSYERPQVDSESQRVSEPSDGGNNSDKASPPEVDDRRSLPSLKRRPRVNYAIAFMALVALIAFMALLSIIATRNGTDVVVVSPDQLQDREEDARK